MTQADRLRAAKVRAERARSRSPNRAAATLSATRVLVAGPPCAGKTTFVLRNIRRGEVLLDMDYLWAGLTGLKLNDKPSGLLPVIRAAWNGALGALGSPAHSTVSAWCVAGVPGAAERWELARRLGGARVLVLATPPDVCRKRAVESRRNPDHVTEWIAKWWSRYESDPRDEILEE